MKRPDPFRRVGFGAPDSVNAHRTIVRIPRSRSELVEIFDDHGEDVAGDRFHHLASLDRPTWDAIADDAAAELNRRLKTRDMKPGRWKAGETLVNRLLGRELVCLVYAVEDRTPAEIEVAVKAWRDLEPEGRWWLTMMASRPGWRRAIGIGLTNEGPDVPVTAAA